MTTRVLPLVVLSLLVGDSRAAAQPTPTPSPATAPQSSTENALYVGFVYGPLVRIAEDGVVASLGVSAGASDLVQGRDGRVYAVLSGQVFVVAGDTLEPVGGEGPVRFTEVAARAPGDIWAASAQRLARFDGRAWTAIDDPRLGAHGIRDLAFDADGSLWVLTADTIFRERSGAFEELRTMEGSSVLKAFVRNAAGGLDVQHFRGLDRYDGRAWSMVPIEWVERSRDGRLAFSSLSHAAFGGGVLALAADRSAELALRVPDVQYLGSSSLGRMQLPATRIHDVAVDGRGRPWFATNGGLLLLERYGDPRVARFWPIHGIAALTRPPTRLLAVGQGPRVVPEIAPAVPARVRGNVGARYASATVQICGELIRRGRDLDCEMNAPSWSGAADSRGRFVLEGVLPGGYAVLVRAGGRVYETTATCCAPRTPGGEIDLDRVDVVR